jgi:hypothetical protein
MYSPCASLKISDVGQQMKTRTMITFLSVNDLQVSISSPETNISGLEPTITSDALSTKENIQMRIQ